MSTYTQRGILTIYTHNGMYQVGIILGGTLDVTIMEFGSGVFEVKASSGHTQLGGTDMDQSLVNYLVNRFREESPKSITAIRRSSPGRFSPYARELAVGLLIMRSTSRPAIRQASIVALRWLSSK